jgi:O-antigen ligase
LDLWLKTGIVGVGVLGLFLATLFYNLFRSYQKTYDYLPHAFLLLLPSLAVVHFFTPYLNHPLGLSLAFAMVPAATMAGGLLRTKGAPA